MLPPAGPVPDEEADRPHDPVDDHGHPDAEHAHAHIFSQDIAENDPEDPHGRHGNDHAHLRVPGRPESSRYGKGKRPDEHTAHRVEDHDIRSDGSRLVRQVVHLEDQRQRQHNDHVCHDHAAVGDEGQLLRVVVDLPVVPCPHAPGNDGRDRQGDGHARQHLEGCQGVGDRVGRDRVGAEGGHEAQHNDLAQLEHAVLKPVGDADAEDLADHPPVRPVFRRKADPDGPLPVRQQGHDEDRGGDPGDEGGDRHALRAPVEPVDQDGVA